MSPIPRIRPACPGETRPALALGILLSVALASGRAEPGPVSRGLSALGLAEPGYRQTLATPFGAHPAGPLVNLTTPWARTTLDGIADTLDVPVNGQRVRPRIHIVEGLQGDVRLEAGGRRILVGRRFLERQSGRTIHSRNPKSVNDALRAILNHPTRRSAFMGAVAHEVGHIAQGHVRPFARGGMASVARPRIHAVREAVLAPQAVEEIQGATRAFIQDRRTQIETRMAHPEFKQALAGDAARIRSGFQQTGSLHQATAFLTARKPGIAPDVAAATPARPSRTARLIHAAEFIRDHPQEFRSGLSRPLSFKVARHAPEIRLDRGLLSGIRVEGLESARARFLPQSPNLSMHLDEFLADEHASTTRFRQTGNLRATLDMTKLTGPTRPWISSSHPTATARRLNLLHHIERHPEVFRSGLTEPMPVRLHRGGPTVTLKPVGDGIQLVGRDAAIKSLSAPEQVIFKHYQEASNRFVTKVAGTGAPTIESALVKGVQESGSTLSGAGTKGAGVAELAPRWGRYLRLGRVGAVLAVAGAMGAVWTATMTDGEGSEPAATIDPSPAVEDPLPDFSVDAVPAADAPIVAGSAPLETPEEAPDASDLDADLILTE